MLAAVANDLDPLLCWYGVWVPFLQGKFIRCCISQDKSVGEKSQNKHMGKRGFTHLHLVVSGSSGDNRALKPLWKAVQSSGPDLGCVSGLSGSISNLLLLGLHFWKALEDEDIHTWPRISDLEQWPPNCSLKAHTSQPWGKRCPHPLPALPSWSWGQCWGKTQG